MLRKTFFLLLLLITTASAASRIDLWFIHRNGCPACAQMEAKMKQPAIAAILKRSFRIHRVERSEQNKLPKLYMHTHTFPTLYFLDAKGEEIVDPIHNVPLREFKRVLLEAVTVGGM